MTFVKLGEIVVTWDVPQYKGHTSSAVLVVYSNRNLNSSRFHRITRGLQNYYPKQRMAQTKLNGTSKLLWTPTLALTFESSLYRS